MTTRKLVNLIATATALAAPTVANATEWVVDPVAPSAPCTSTVPTCATVGAAVGAAANNDTVSIKPGTYPESVSVTLDSLTITRAPGAGVVKLTGNGTAAPLTVSGAGPYSVSGIELLAQGTNVNGMEVIGKDGNILGSQGVLGMKPEIVLVSSVVLSGSGANSYGLLVRGGKAGTVTANIGHVTIADHGNAGALNLDQATNQESGVTANVHNSIVHGTITQQGAVTLDEQRDDFNTPAEALFRDPTVEDFRLRASAPNVMSGGSAGETGEPPIDVEGEARPSGGWDMGADEFTDSGPPNAPSLSVAPQQATAGSAVTMTAGDVTDPDFGDAFEYVWDFGDGTHQVTADSSNSHAYELAGTYTVTVRAQDVSGARGPSSAPVVVHVASKPVQDVRSGQGGSFAPGGSGNTTTSGAPTLRILSPRRRQSVRRTRLRTVAIRGRKVRQLVTFPFTINGRASAGSGLRRVELALALVRGSSCRFYDGGRRLRLRPCDRPIFVRATIDDFAWSFTVPATVKLPRGAYLLSARATDLTGATSTFSAAARSVVRFRLR
jgi:PKD repeat protein